MSMQDILSRSDDRVLVGDVGGTNVRFAMATLNSLGQISLDNIWSSAARNFKTFNSAMTTYIAEATTQPKRAVFALAGPVNGDQVALTNQPWVISQRALTEEFGFEFLKVVNDFAAMARSVPLLPRSALNILQAGQNLQDLPIAVMGAGTGLGQALLIPSEPNWTVVPGEGGHQSFAPQNNTEFEVVKVLKAKYGHVSAELICSGSGLARVYSAFCEIDGVDNSMTISQEQITRLAQLGDGKANERCMRTCQFVADALASFAGDAVLAGGAWGGGIIAGGVSNHLAPFLNREETIARFSEKGLMTSRLKKTTLALLTDRTAALHGAAEFSRNLVTTGQAS